MPFLKGTVNSSGWQVGVGEGVGGGVTRMGVKGG